MKKFNLQDEPWILATNLNGQEEILSLTDVLVHSHELRNLSGEMPAQDIAIMRLLLGVMYAIYTRTEEYKDAQENKRSGQCIEIWKKLWLRKHFPEQEIKEYLDKHHDRFWLRHPERPFYQVNEIKKGSEFSVSKMIGELVEGGNKVQMFPLRSGKSKQYLDYPEVARWLLYLNSFDDASAKPSKKGLNSMSVGWLGQLGMVYLMGKNIFETLMLNFSLLNHNEPWNSGECKATWELKETRTSERTIINMPEGGEELFTLQSRRIQLKWVDDSVFGFTLLGGDGFSSENAFAEPMTTWRAAKDKKDVYIPPSNVSRNSSKQIWRDFASLLVESEGVRKPGILKWASMLEGKDIISSAQIQICTLQIKYGNMQCGIDDVWGDSLSVNSSLLLPLGDVWVGRIERLIQLTEKFVRELGNLSSIIAIASGASDGKDIRNTTQEQAYATLDMPFRSWIASIDPETDSITEKCDSWVTDVRKIILKLGEDLVNQAGSQAFVGKNVIINKKEYHYNTPRSHGWFKGKIFKIEKDYYGGGDKK